MVAAAGPFSTVALVVCGAFSGFGLGGPWFREQRTMGGPLAAEWFSARDDAMKLWD